MIPEAQDPNLIWQAIAIAVLVLLAMVALAWFVTSRRKRRAQTETTQASTDRFSTRDEVSGLQEKYELMTARLDRHEKNYSALQEEHNRMLAEREAEKQNLATLERQQKEQQEQIYELREEHKMLLQREDRQERKVNELQEQLSAVEARGRNSVA